MKKGLKDTIMEAIEKLVLNCDVLQKEGVKDPEIAKSKLESSVHQSIPLFLKCVGLPIETYGQYLLF